MSSKKKQLVKVMAIAFAILVIANITLLALGKISLRAFWMIIILAAFVAWWVLPKVNEG